MDGLDIRAIRAFWRAYRRDTTYNLTNRNCSSGVAKALDAGLEGMFEGRARSPYFLIRLLFLPELWVAGALIGPVLAGVAMQLTTHGSPLFVALACVLFMVAALRFKDDASSG